MNHRMSAPPRQHAATPNRRSSWVRFASAFAMLTLLLALVALSVFAGAHGMAAAHPLSASAFVAHATSPFGLCPPGIVVCP